MMSGADGTKLLQQQGRMQSWGSTAPMAHHIFNVPHAHGTHGRVLQRARTPHLKSTLPLLPDSQLLQQGCLLPFRLLQASRVA